MTSRTKLGTELEAALREAIAHSKGELTLTARAIEPMTAERVRAIRKSVAASPREFERRFGVPARTLEGWEQGRGVDAAARVLLRVIEKEPEAVERAVG